MDLQKRFADLRGDVEAFRLSFETLLNSLAAVERDAIRGDSFIECENATTILPSLCEVERFSEISELSCDQFVSALSSIGAATETRASSQSCKMKLHDRWVHMYLANEDAIMEAEQTQYMDETRGSECRNSSSIQSFLRVLKRHSTGVHTLMPSRFGLQTRLGFASVLHPYGAGRILWDVIGACLVIVDVFLLPISIAWEFEIEVGSFEYHFLTGSIIYWFFDIILNFNTAFLDKSGTLIASRRRVALNYVFGWFFFDILTVLIDCFIWLFLSTSLLTVLKSLRVFRMLRLARGLRVTKLVSLGSAIESLGSVQGRQALTLVLAFVRTIFSIFSLAHVLACFWYALGKTEESKGNTSWLGLLRHRHGAIDEYVQALAWILGHLTANSVDVSITPEAFSEQVFMLFITLVSLIVLSCGIAKITETLLAIEKLNSESTRAKRVLNRFLQANEIPINLRVRVLGCVIQKIKQRFETSLEPGLQELLSSSLAGELVVSQRLKHIVIYPFFSYLTQCYNTITTQLCKAFDTRDFAAGENVFENSTPAEVFVIMRHGTFLEFHSGSEFMGIEHSEPTFFAEYSLYAKTDYRTSLRVLTTADILELSGHSFAESIKDSPACIALIFKYAQQFTNVPNEEISFTRKEKCEEILDDMLSTTRMWNTVRSTVQHDSCFEDNHSRLRYLERVYDRVISMDDVRDNLEWLFPELADDGVYINFGEIDERLRSQCAILSIIYIHFNAYEAFTIDQSIDTRLTFDQWTELQEIYEWTALAKDQFCAMLVLLAIRGLGKVEAIIRSLPVHLRNSENAVANLMSCMPQFMPSTSSLGDDMKRCVSEILHVSKMFNMHQFLQGENTPSQLQGLKLLLEDMNDQTVFKCYMIIFLGVMCSLRGDTCPRSSTHMTTHNGAIVLLAIRSLRNIEYEQPLKVYWSFIRSRAKQLNMSCSTNEDQVLARLACLIRAKEGDCAMLSKIWKLLSYSERKSLTRHFLADGIVTSAVVFAFLPSYLLNSKTNVHVGLLKGLSLLVELLEQLNANGFMPKGDMLTTTVSLQSLARLVAEVQRARDIEFLSPHIRFVQHGTGLLAIVSAKMYRSIKDPKFQHDVEDKDIAYALKRLERKAVGQDRMLSHLVRMREERSMQCVGPTAKHVPSAPDQKPSQILAMNDEGFATEQREMVAQTKLVPPGGIRLVPGVTSTHRSD